MGITEDVVGDVGHGTYHFPVSHETTRTELDVMEGSSEYVPWLSATNVRTLFRVFQCTSSTLSWNLERQIFQIYAKHCAGSSNVVKINCRVVRRATDIKIYLCISLNMYSEYADMNAEMTRNIIFQSIYVMYMACRVCRQKFVCIRSYE